jgi:tryptophan-rich sensory protein
MTKLPVALLLAGAVSMGLMLGVLYLRGMRKPGLVAVHVLLGLGALETMMVAVRSTSASTTAAMVAAGFLAWSAFSGLIRPMVADRSQRNGNGLLITHATAGLTGFVIFLVWAARS